MTWESELRMIRNLSRSTPIGITRRLSHFVPRFASSKAYKRPSTMGKGRKARGEVGEEYLHLPAHPSASPASSMIYDTHTHLLSTYAEYMTKYPTSTAYSNVHDFVRGVLCSDVPPPSSNTDGMRNSSRACVSFIKKYCSPLSPRLTAQDWRID